MRSTRPARWNSAPNAVLKNPSVISVSVKDFFSARWREAMAGISAEAAASQAAPSNPIAARPPAMIADFEARCVRGDDRRWRFQSHVLRPFIIGNDLPASIMIRPQSL